MAIKTFRPIAAQPKEPSMRRFVDGINQAMVDLYTALKPLGASTPLGTMATQDKAAVDVDGGVIDGTTIGGSTPAAGTFTDLRANDKLGLGLAPVVRQSHIGDPAAMAAQTQEDLADETSGVPDLTVGDVIDAGDLTDNTEINDNFADILVQLANVKTDLAAAKAAIDANNAVIDALLVLVETFGLTATS